MIRDNEGNRGNNVDLGGTGFGGTLVGWPLVGVLLTSCVGDCKESMGALAGSTDSLFSGSPGAGSLDAGSLLADSSSVGLFWRDIRGLLVAVADMNDKRQRKVIQLIQDSRL